MTICTHTSYFFADHPMEMFYCVAFLYIGRMIITPKCSCLGYHLKSLLQESNDILIVSEFCYVTIAIVIATQYAVMKSSCTGTESKVYVAECHLKCTLPNSVKEYLTSFKSKCQEVLLLVFKNADLTCHLRGIILSEN